MDQHHLDRVDTVNFGSYYTPQRLVDIVYSLIRKNIARPDTYYILDTSCGYGAFLRGTRTIGADIDAEAIRNAKRLAPQYTYFIHNSLLETARSQYCLNADDALIIVGNPPYNDASSLTKKSIKKVEFARDADLQCRDIGVSFLLSYNKLRADYVCALHPLSFLIKKVNFESLGAFKDNYTLIDSLVFSSTEFSRTSRQSCFPIIAALYKRNHSGMNFNYIRNYVFTSYERATFSINTFDSIGNYISKYPNHKRVDGTETVAHFYTMRDINALKRAATFLTKETSSSIRVTMDTLPYYCYVDIFKDYIPHIPYYLGNSDVMINNDDFKEIEPLFMSASVKKRPALTRYIEARRYPKADADAEIAAYFKRLLGAHFRALP
jgi:hypothetical protein